MGRRPKREGALRGMWACVVCGRGGWCTARTILPSQHGQTLPWARGQIARDKLIPKRRLGVCAPGLKRPRGPGAITTGLARHTGRGMGADGCKCPFRPQASEEPTPHLRRGALHLAEAGFDGFSKIWLTSRHVLSRRIASHLAAPPMEGERVVHEGAGSRLHHRRRGGAGRLLSRRWGRRRTAPKGTALLGCRQTRSGQVETRGCPKRRDRLAPSSSSPTLKPTIPAQSRTRVPLPAAPAASCILHTTPPAYEVHTKLTRPRFARLASLWTRHPREAGCGETLKQGDGLRRCEATLTACSESLVGGGRAALPTNARQERADGVPSTASHWPLGACVAFAPFANQQQYVSRRHPKQPTCFPVCQLPGERGAVATPSLAGAEAGSSPRAR